MAKRVGILTGGGDVPGLNAAIQQFVWRMEEEGYEVLGLRRGWAALLHVKPYHDADNSAWLVPLTRASTRTIDRSGGTVLHMLADQPRPHQPRQRPRAPARPCQQGAARRPARPDRRRAEVLRFLHLDTLVAIGGDGTLSFARRLHLEGGEDHRPAEDDGQRRLRHRLLHRLLDGDHPLGQLHQRPAHGRRARTSASWWSSCSAATRARPACSPPISRAPTGR